MQSIKIYFLNSSTDNGPRCGPGFADGGGEHAAERDDEQSIGLWVSGFFGSGKSLLVKVLGIVLEGADLERFRREMGEATVRA